MAIGELQHRRGPTISRLLLTPLAGEFFIDTDTWLVYIGDGLTAGGLLVGQNVSAALIVTKTSNYSLTTDDSGNQFNNTGAAGDIVLTLPPAVVGLNYAGAVTEAFYLRFSADGTDKIAWGEDNSASGGYIRHNAPFAFVSLICHLAGQWLVSSVAGSWKIDT